ncbi:uncharacterized protein AB9W97_017979 [Spinachia spinachia]
MNLSDTLICVFFFTPISPQPTVTTTQSVSSSTGSFTPPSAPPGGAKTTREARTTTSLLPYVRLTLGVMFIVLSASVLILCSKRARKPKEPPVESDYVNVPQANQASDETTEEEASPGSEMSAV